MPIAQIARALNRLLNLPTSECDRLANKVWDDGLAVVKTTDFETAEYYQELLSTFTTLPTGERFGYVTSIKPK